MKDTEGVFRDQRAPVFAHAAYGLRYPDGVTGKQLVVFRRTKHPHHAQFNHQLIHEFLCFGFRNPASRQITLDINIQEGRNAANGHGGTILFLNGSQIAEVYPLHSFTGIFGRCADIKAITLRHRLEVV